MRLFGFIMLFAIMYLSYDIYFGRNGILEYQAVSAKLKEAQAKSELLTKRNVALQEELDDLQQGSIAVEELARSELGLIKEGEVFYRVIHPKSN